MDVTIVFVEQRILMGKSVTMSFVNHKTQDLWQSFRSDITRLGIAIKTPFINLHDYPKDFSFSAFNPSKEFEKWALLEVQENVAIPKDFVKFVLEEGYYATFEYQGLAKDCQMQIQKVFTQWLPNSGYQLDNRPHFEALGEGYHPLDANSRERIFIPIQKI